MKHSSINRIFLPLIAALYIGGFLAARSTAYYNLSLTLLAMGTILNFFAIIFLGTDLLLKEGPPVNTKKRTYLLSYGLLLMTICIVLIVQSPVSEHPDNAGTLVVFAVIGTGLVLLLAAFAQKRTEKKIKTIEQETYEHIKEHDSFFRIVKYAVVTSSRIDSMEYSERRKWFITFATAVLIAAPYFGFLAGIMIEHLTPFVKYVQSLLPVPKWMVAIPFMLPIMGVIALPSVFFYFLMGVIMIEHREKSAVRAELNAARTVQMGLMPTRDPVVQGFDVSGKCIPASEVGGDYYDYIWMNAEETQLGIAIADVSGKAMKAAMTAVMTSGMVYREVGSNETPKSILRKINRPMYLKTDRRVFTAMCFAVLDSKNKRLDFSNAGQTFPMLLRNGSVEYLRVEGERLPLGVKEEVAYEERKVNLQQGDVVIFYTDGVTEAKNSREELFGEEKLEQMLKKADARQSSSDIITGILKSLQEYSGSAPQHDDMTVVVVRVL